MDIQRLDSIVVPVGEGHHWDAPAVVAPVASATAGLTPREREVLHHLSWRATDREIADALSISPRTVMHHVSSVLAKLGVENRRQAAHWATSLGLD
jgi:DNA-binding CsgD family transcriptional regulator